MSTREIQGHLEEMYGVDVSPTLISNVTEAVMEEVKSWQSRPLDEMYPIVYLDALRVKIRERATCGTGRSTWRSASTCKATKKCWGCGRARTKGPKFWLQVLTEMKNRGVSDIFIACVDGLKGFPEAIEVVFPQPQCSCASCIRCGAR